jgi:hypothetical protein
MTVTIEKWIGCYEERWSDFITDEAYAHPAKFAHGLITRIFNEMLRNGMLKKGDVVVDPFGGVGCGGIVAASLGLQWVGCELEPDFHRLAVGYDCPGFSKGVGVVNREALCRDCRKAYDDPFGAHFINCHHVFGNFEIFARTWRELGDPFPIMVCGDSRQLRKHLAGVLAEACIASPPFNGSDQPCASQTGTIRDGGYDAIKAPTKRDATLTATTPGQLGSMPNEVNNTPGDITEGRGRWEGGTNSAARVKQDHDYDTQTSGQLGSMAEGTISVVVSSPPYAESLKGDNSEQETAEESRAKRNTEGGSLGRSCRHSGYGGDRNLGNLEAGDIDSVVTSPPYQNGVVHDGNGCTQREGDGHTSQLITMGEYGRSPGQLGQEQGETFWSAARDIVAECYAILKPGGWSAWVVKDFIRDKQRVPFCDDWCRLLEACGFEVTNRVHAMLTVEDRHPSLFGDEDIVKTKERKSFFRRIYEKKYPENSIDFEEVIFARKRASA